jgi:hypothetical protein
VAFAAELATLIEHRAVDEPRGRPLAAVCSRRSLMHTPLSADAKEDR